MRILQIAPVWESVPPPAYGGTEAVVSEVVESLVARGHDVTLWASGDSTTSARLRWSSPRSLRRANDLTDRAPHDWLHLSRAAEDAATGGYDLIHNHAGELGLAFLRLLPSLPPILSTMHYTATSDSLALWDDAPGWFNTVSQSQSQLLPLLRRPRYAGVVHNGIPVETFPFSSVKERYLLFLSRMSEEKAPHLAIEVARRSGIPIIMAGKVDWREQDYFQSVIAPQVDGASVQYLGEADAQLKRRLYRDALALLLPLQWDEPFGLVTIEAMACGTPVIAFPRGAVPELIIHGETGFLVPDADAMFEAVARLHYISPMRCRAHVAEHFDSSQMVRRYLAVYQTMRASTPCYTAVNGHTPPSPRRVHESA